jgi:putative methyltransferase
MTVNRKLRILISEPNATVRAVYLPYLWAVLSSYCKHVGGIHEHCEWLKPIYRRGEPDMLLQPYGDAPIDVLGLSCYTWNWELQQRLAQRMKERDPNCLVVAGGPDPDYKDPAFFQKHPCIDVIVVQDGEIPFSKILATLLQGKRDFRHIPGLYLPAPADTALPVLGQTGHISTGKAEVPTEFPHSPYLEHRDYYEGLARKHAKETFALIWETNRGCPYSCSFCDWGSSTMSKVRKFDQARLEAEIEWIGRLSPQFMFLADANFGILPRDIDLAERLAKVRRELGGPRYIYYSAAKNNPERTVEIAKKFAGTGLSPAHALSIQHTDPEVLAATERANISVEKQKEVVRQLTDAGIPIDVQFIVGIPGDTYAKWRKCLTDLMEWGVHAYYYVFPYCLLPNAPAADVAFRRQWEIETVDRYVIGDDSGFRRKGADHDRLKMPLIVASKTFSRQDWVGMRTFTAFAKALHGCGVTHLVALYLRYTRGISFEQFYARLVEEFASRVPPVRAWHQRLTDLYQAIGSSAGQHGSSATCFSARSRPGPF